MKTDRYKYTLKNDVSYLTDYYNQEFNSKWFTIEKNGRMTVKKGYSFDGCSPSFKLFKIRGKQFYVGTPDFKKTYYTALIHDAIYQFKLKCRLSQYDADKLFKEAMEIEKFRLKRIYYWFVKTFGKYMGEWGSNIDHCITLAKIIK